MTTGLGACPRPARATRGSRRPSGPKQGLQAVQRVGVERFLGVQEGQEQRLTGLALARDRLPELQPDVVLWELWGNAPHHFTMVGGEAWSFGPLAPPEGGPPAPLDLPRALTGALFSVSGLWRLWSVQGEPPPPPGGDPLAPWHGLVDEGLGLVRELGALLVLVVASPLARPFAETAASVPRGHLLVRDRAAAHGVPWIDVAAAWTHLDPRQLRLDPCCHLNAAGHQALAELLVGELASLPIPPEG